MKNYWDLSRHERAQLTDDEVDKFCRIELMEKGLSRPPCPDKLPLNDVSVSRRVLWHFEYNFGGYQKIAEDVAFPSEEATNSALALCSGVIDKHYGAEPVLCTITGVSARSVLADSGALADVQAKKIANKSIQDANDEARSVYEDKCTECDNALAGLYADLLSCRSMGVNCERVARVFQEYLDTAGDAPIALKFLRKSFTDEEISDAEKWLGSKFG